MFVHCTRTRLTGDAHFGNKESAARGDRSRSHLVDGQRREAIEKGTLVTIIRVGTTKNYNENWEKAFGGKRAGAKATASAAPAKASAKRSTASAKKKPAKNKSKKK
jgi:hypothetical protein